MEMIPCDVWWSISPSSLLPSDRFTGRHILVMVVPLTGGGHSVWRSSVLVIHQPSSARGEGAESFSLRSARNPPP